MSALQDCGRAPNGAMSAQTFRDLHEEVRDAAQELADAEAAILDAAGLS
jgi:hypothetical protein